MNQRIENKKNLVFEIHELEEKIESIKKELDDSVGQMKNVVELYKNGRLKFFSNRLGYLVRDNTYEQVREIPDNTEFKNNLKEFQMSCEKLTELKQNLKRMR